MSKFQKIVCLDDTRLTPIALNQLSDFADEVCVFQDMPTSAEEIVKRLVGADAVLVSWRTPIDAVTIAQVPSLKYIGMCCSLIDKKAANVDVTFAEEQGIVVKAVKDYGDEGVVEFIFSQLIQLAKGLGTQQWKAQQTELKGKTLGIIGFGTVGQMVAQVAQVFGMKVLYYSRTPKPWLEHTHLQYASLADLLGKSDVITTHLPRYTQLLDAAAFALMKKNSVLINTSLGPTYVVNDMLNWLDYGQNFLIVDADGASGSGNFHRNHPQIMFSEKTSGMTDAAFERLSTKVLTNIEEYWQEVNSCS